MDAVLELWECASPIARMVKLPNFCTAPSILDLGAKLEDGSKQRVQLKLHLEDLYNNTRRCSKILCTKKRVTGQGNMSTN